MRRGGEGAGVVLKEDGPVTRRCGTYGRLRLLLVASVVALAVGVVSASAERQRLVGGREGSGALAPLRGGEGGAVFWTRGVIDGLAVDGSLVAVSTHAIAESCDRIVVWIAPGKKFTSFDTHVGCPDGFPNFWFVRELALGAGRVAWIEVVAGNSQEMYLYEASASGGPSRKLDTAYNGYGASGDWAGDWIGQLFGSGATLAYNRWTLCNWLASDGRATAECPVEGRVSAATLGEVRRDGRRIRLRTGPGVFRLRAVAAGRLAIEPMSTFRPGYETSDGSRYGPGLGNGSGEILVLSQAGNVTATVLAAPDSGGPRAVALSRSQLVIQRRSTLDVHSPASGRLIRAIPLGASRRLRLVGASAALAILSGTHHLVAVRLSDGMQATIPLPAEAKATTSLIRPRLSEAGLFYAYNVTGTPAKGRIVYTPTDQLLARFG